MPRIETRLSSIVLLLTALAAGTLKAEDASRRAQLSEAFGKLPLQFESNAGQADRAVQYLAHGPGYTLFLTKNEAALALRRVNGAKLVGSTDLHMHLMGANSNPQLVPQSPLRGQVNYFRGNDKNNWHSGIATWGRVKYAQVYPGVDLVFYGNQGQMEFDFVAAPGADLSQIRFRIDGARPELDPDGNVVLTADGGRMVIRKPVVYQGEGDQRHLIPGRFTVAKSGEIAFAAGQYDRSKPLVIDPTLIYASYLGGTADNAITGIAVNANGEAYVTGYTFAANFPTTSNAFQQLQPMCEPGVCTNTTGPDAFVAHISADGTQLLYSTYLGGNNEDEGRAITVDSSGDAYVTGYTFSNDFPLMSPFQSLCSPTGVQNLSTFSWSLEAACEGHPPGEALVYEQNTPDVFITKLNPSGSAILYSTFFGGSGNDNPNGIALDTQGNIYIAGSTSSVYRSDAGFFPNGGDVPFPVTAAFEDGKHGTENQNYFLAFVAEFSADGQSLLYSSTFGGPPGSTVAQGTTSMALGTNGQVFIGGDVTSTAMPTKNAIQTGCVPVVGSSTSCAGSGFVAGFDTTQSGAASLLFATYLGGNVPSGAVTTLSGVAVDALNNVIATGATQAHDFPSTPGTFSPGCTNPDTTRSCNDAYLIKLSSSGGLVWETNYGFGAVPCPALSGNAVTTDSKNNIYFAGTTPGCSGPLKNPFQSGANGDNMFLVTLSSDGTQLLFGSLYGGNGSDNPMTIALDPSDNIYFGGATNSTNLPGTTGFFQPNYAGGARNGFVGKVSPIYMASSISMVANPSPATAGQNVTLTATVTGQTGQPAPTGSVIFYNGTTALSATVSVSAGQASFMTSSLGVGPNELTAIYGGDNLYFGSTSSTVPLTVSPAVNSTTTTASNAMVTYSPNAQNVTLTATVTSTSTVSTGSVTFTLFGSSLTGNVVNGSASVMFSVPAGKTAANYPIQASYNAGAGFSASSDNLKQLTISMATPLITWANPADIIAGAALSSSQLNATANVLGAFAYTPISGTILSAGNGQTLSVMFTPTDFTDYTSAMAHVLINVDPATVTVSVTPPSLIFSAANTGTTSGAQNVTIKNTGNSALSITSITPSGDFGRTNNCPSSLPATMSCTVAVTFSPTGTGTRTGMLTLVDGAGTQTVSLTGTGLLGSPRINIVLAGSGTHSAGVLYADLKITNTGTGLAENVKITHIDTLAIPAVHLDALTPALPISIGNLAVRATTTVRIYVDASPQPPVIVLAELGSLQNANGLNEEFASAQAVLKK